MYRLSRPIALLAQARQARVNDDLGKAGEEVSTSLMYRYDMGVKEPAILIYGVAGSAVLWAGAGASCRREARVKADKASSGMV
jgi:hypothetical protein